MRWNEPTDPMKVTKVIISDWRGSDKRVNKDREVKTLAVSRVVPSLLLRAITEKTANVTIGAATGVMYAKNGQTVTLKGTLGTLTKSHVPD